jgi:hypothetical protein
MESKYKERAIELLIQKEILLNKDLNTHFNLNLTRDTHVATTKWIVDAMCQLAEEVEKVYKDPLMFGEEGSIQRVYSRAYVEELLEKQRELSAEKADMCDENGNTISTLYMYDEHTREIEWTVNKDSIKNAKLKID